jgi:hypothetical protein
VQPDVTTVHRRAGAEKKGMAEWVGGCRVQPDVTTVHRRAGAGEQRVYRQRVYKGG